MHATYIFTRRMHELEDEEFEYDQKMEYIMKTHTYLKTKLCVISQSFCLNDGVVRTTRFLY